jgi:hypothetical protein
MNLSIRHDDFGRLVCAIEAEGREALVTGSDAATAARDLLAALDDVTVTGYGECRWLEAAGEYRWMLRRHSQALTVAVLWSSGTVTGWQHVVHTTTPFDAFVHQLLPLRESLAGKS